MCLKVTTISLLSITDGNCFFSSSKYLFSYQKGTQIKQHTFYESESYVSFFLWLLTLMFNDASEPSAQSPKFLRPAYP